MNDHRRHFINLQALARQLMLENGFEPDFPPEVEQQLAELRITRHKPHRVETFVTCGICFGLPLTTTPRAIWIRLK